MKPPGRCVVERVTLWLAMGQYRSQLARVSPLLCHSWGMTIHMGAPEKNVISVVCVRVRTGRSVVCDPFGY